jgi:hypothetical protein
VLSYQNTSQWFPLGSSTQQQGSPPSFVDQPDMFDLGILSMPQSINDLSGIDFSPPMVEMDAFFDYVDPALFTDVAPSNSLSNVPETPFEMLSVDVSLSGLLDLNFTL